MLIVVDGTAKLPAKSKPSDKHEAPELNIEEATVASPRPSRKRAGDYFDFDDGVIGGPSSKSAESKATKSNKKTKTTPAGKEENSNEGGAKPAATARIGRKGKGSKDEVVEFPSETVTKAVEKEKRPRKPKVAKDDVAEEKPEKSKSKKAIKELAAEKTPKNEATPNTAKAETKTKAKKSNDEKVAAEYESSTVAPDVAMDEGRLASLLESEKVQAAGATAGTGSQAKPAAKNAKKPAKGSKANKVESAKASAAEPAADGSNLVKKGAKAGTEKVKKVAKSTVPATETAADVADAVKKGTKAGTEKAKQAAKSTIPATETAVDVADTVKKGIKAETGKAKQAAKSTVSATETAVDVADAVKKGTKAGTEKAKRAARSMAPATEKATDVADAVKKGTKAGSEKTKKGGKLKDSKPTKDAESVQLTGSTEEQSKAEASKSKKRKAPASADTEMVKTDILDPLSEHASAKKKQKKANSTKSLGDTVGGLIATATEGANAAGASLGDLATSIMGGVGEAAEGATNAEELAKGSAKNAKGKGKAIAKDVAESSGEIAATDAPEDADSDDESDDELDDHTTVLLAGFESDEDDGPVPGPGFEQGQKIPRLPQAETTAKKLEGVKDGADEGSGVVYIGRIPHGFYEHEMREYFSQFGDISRLRLSRSQKSGASRHYAFVEFTSAGVAKIVADTMDNYLMFGHILKCKVLAKEQVHESLWKGANKRFKAVPWNKIEGRKFEMGLGREQWAERIEEEKKRRASKNEKTKEIGYEFEAGELKGVDEVPVRDAATEIENKEMENGEKLEEETSLVTAGGEGGNGSVVVSEEVKTKRVKKVKGKAEETTTAMAKRTKRALDAGEEVVGSAVKKSRKGKNVAA